MQPPPAFKERTLELSGDSDDEFVTALRDIWERLDIPQEATVIYPGSGTHVGVARIAGKDRVVHIDPDPDAVATLRAHEYDAVATRIEDYDLQVPADVMVALNAYGKITEDIVQKLLKPGGYLITNNHTHWARDAAGLQNLDLQGAVLPSYGAADARYYEGDEIPVDATGDVTKYYIYPPSGGVYEAAATDEGAEPETTPRYRNGLFVFQRVEQET